MKKFIILILTVIIFNKLSAQIDSSLFKRIVQDSSKSSMNMDAVYTRPFLSVSKFPVAIGGYMEVNWLHSGTNGISEGHQFQMRRMTLFVASTINKRIKFLSEIELEEGGKSLSIEFASVDFEFHPLLNLRGGIVMNPIGAFNQNHDGPKWEFSDRPISSTQMLPATWSNAGFGLYGKAYKNKMMFGYEAYVTGGFDNTIIDNNLNKTFLPASKANLNRFEASASGTPLITAKVAAKKQTIGEIGMSYMGGIYNTFLSEGLPIDVKRKLNVFAVDYSTQLPRLKTVIISEFAWVFVDVPETYTQQYGNKQQGGYIDIIQPLIRKSMFGWQDAVLNLSCRLEYVDWNIGRFNETNTNIYESLWSVMPSVSFRPSALTVFRFNYRYQEQKDLFGNPADRTGAFSFGISSYF